MLVPIHAHSRITDGPSSFPGSTFFPSSLSSWLSTCPAVHLSNGPHANRGHSVNGRARMQASLPPPLLTCLCNRALPHKPNPHSYFDPGPLTGQVRHIMSGEPLLFVLLTSFQVRIDTFTPAYPCKSARSTPRLIRAPSLMQSQSEDRRPALHHTQHRTIASSCQTCLPNPSLSRPTKVNAACLYARVSNHRAKLSMP